jgi:hypothetical protein
MEDDRMGFGVMRDNFRKPRADVCGFFCVAGPGRARFSCCLIAFFLGPVAAAQPDEPPMETRVLADGHGNSEWHTAEATMRPDATHAMEGRAMRFHIDVNHETGQPDYPIGWPRTYLSLPENARDWRKWDFVEFWLYADTSRNSLPGTPLGFIVRSPDKPNSYQRTVHEAHKGKWIHVRVPTSDMPSPGQCTAVQFFVAESNYNHGDVLDFWIDGLALVRHAQPTVISMQPLGRVQYADADVVRIEVGMTGLEEGQTAELLARLVRDGQTVRRSSAVLRSGIQTVPLELGGKLDAGCYELQAQIAGSRRTVTRTIRVISSPWEEEAP